MKKCLALYFWVCIGAAFTLSAGQGIPTCAVLTFAQGRNIPVNEGQRIADRCASLLGEVPFYEVLDRKQTMKRLQRADVESAEGCSTTECAVQAGRILGVQYVVYGAIGQRDTGHVIKTGLVDVDMGRRISTATTEVAGSMAEMDTSGPAQNMQSLFKLSTPPASWTSMAMPSAPPKALAEQKPLSRTERPRMAAPVGTHDVSGGWKVIPRAGLLVPLSADQSTPDPTYNLGVTVQKGKWLFCADYSSGDGTAEDGWDVTDIPSDPGTFDYTMTGVTALRLFSDPYTQGLRFGGGAGIWRESVDFTADSSVGPARTGASVTGVESDTIIVCGEGLLGYTWPRIELASRLQLFLGGDNITSALTLEAGVSF